MSDLGNREVMAENIRYYMDKHGKSRNDMCELLGVAYTTFSDWYNGNKYPRIDKIEMMANLFGIKKSGLVERRDPEERKESPAPEGAGDITTDQLREILVRHGWIEPNDDLTEQQYTILSSLIDAIKATIKGDKN